MKENGPAKQKRKGKAARNEWENGGEMRAGGKERLVQNGEGRRYPEGTSRSCTNTRKWRRAVIRTWQERAKLEARGSDELKAANKEGTGQMARRGGGPKERRGLCGWATSVPKRQVPVRPAQQTAGTNKRAQFRHACHHLTFLRGYYAQSFFPTLEPVSCLLPTSSLSGQFLGFEVSVLNFRRFGFWHLSFFSVSTDKRPFRLFRSILY